MPVVTAVVAIIVALIAAWSLKESDERKRAQEDRRRWDTDLVETVIALLNITDDVVSTEDEVRKKKEAALAGDLPVEINRHLIKIGLLTNDGLVELAQETAIQFMKERISMEKYLKAEVENGRTVDEIKVIPGHSLNSTAGEAYTNARFQFIRAFQKLVVSVSVQKFTDVESMNWKKLVKAVKEDEKRASRQAAGVTYLRDMVL